MAMHLVPETMLGDGCYYHPCFPLGKLRLRRAQQHPSGPTALNARARIRIHFWDLRDGPYHLGLTRLMGPCFWYGTLLRTEFSKPHQKTLMGAALKVPVGVGNRDTRARRDRSLGLERVWCWSTHSLGIFSDLWVLGA